MQELPTRALDGTNAPDCDVGVIEATYDFVISGPRRFAPAWNWRSTQFHHSFGKRNWRTGSAFEWHRSERARRGVAIPARLASSKTAAQPFCEGSASMGGEGYLLPAFIRHRADDAGRRRLLRSVAELDVHLPGLEEWPPVS
jgi:hypothetical protein